MGNRYLNCTLVFLCMNLTILIHNSSSNLCKCNHTNHNYGIPLKRCLQNLNMCAVNICSVQNGARIYKRSSQSNSRYAPASNVLSSQRSLVWISQDGLPQSLTLDLRHLIKRPKQIKYIGFDFWHDYESNPKIIEVQIKQYGAGDDEDFIAWRTVKLECRVGVQYFELDPIPTRFDLIRILIKETYGANQTYMNQIMLYANNPVSMRSSNSLKISGEEFSNQWRRSSQSRFKNSMDLHDQQQQDQKQDDYEQEQVKHQMSSSQVQQDSLSGIVQSQRQSRQLSNNFAVLQHNMVSIKDNLQEMFRRMENMAMRLERTERTQQDMEVRIISHLEKYIDRKLESRGSVTASVEKRELELHQLFRQLHEKLLLKEKKLDKLNKDKR